MDVIGRFIFMRSARHPFVGYGSKWMPTEQEVDLLDFGTGTGYVNYILYDI
jgi:hypothetical protein